MSETIQQYLHRVLRKEIEKGYGVAAGFRSTRDVADYFGWSIARARRALSVQHERGLIDCYQDAPGRQMDWRACLNDNDGGEEETIRLAA